MFLPDGKNRGALLRWLAAGGGSGYLPGAPGSWGSLVGLGLGTLLLADSPRALAAGTLAAILIGFGSLRFGLEPAALDDDPGWIVIDEVAGQCVALLGLHRPSLLGVAAAFGLFRLLDIAKPGPVGWADRLGGSVGIMADDLIAGAIAAVLLAIAGIGR